MKLFWQLFSQNFKLVGFYSKTFITPPFCFNEAFCFYWWVVLIIKIFILHCKNFIAPLIFLFALQLEGVSDIFLSNQALVHCCTVCLRRAPSIDLGCPTLLLIFFAAPNKMCQIGYRRKIWPNISQAYTPIELFDSVLLVLIRSAWIIHPMLPPRLFSINFENWWNFQNSECSSIWHFTSWF